MQISLIRAKNSASAGIYNMYIMCTYNIVKAVSSAYRRIFRRDCLRRSVGMAAHMPNRFAILGDVIVTGGTDSRKLTMSLCGVPRSRAGFKRVFLGRYIVVLWSVCLSVISSAAHTADCLSGFFVVFRISSVCMLVLSAAAALWRCFSSFRRGVLHCGIFLPNGDFVQ